MTSFQLPFSMIVLVEGDLRIPFSRWREVARAFSEALDRRRVVGRRSKDHAGSLAGDRLQPVVGWLEVRPHVPGVEQPAVKLVGPLMVGADELRGLASERGADPAAAVAAGVVEGADLPVGRAR